MISDFVKGKKKFDYPAGIQKGISLHRFIDEFTDTHEATREAKLVFRPAYRLYSGAIVDVIYDHFLANDLHEFPASGLATFSLKTYAILDQNIHWFPAGFAAMFPYMKKQNWLLNYQNQRGTANSLGGLIRRAAYLTESDTAFNLFVQHYQLLEACYRHFWADVKPFAAAQLENQ